jgi:glucose/arabinose dehydrogenase
MNLRGIVLGSAVLLSASAVLHAQQKALPAPYATPSANNRPRVIPKPEGAKLSVPPGFQVEIFQEGFKVPRFMLLGPSNEILLTDAARGTDGTVYVLQGKERKAILQGLDRPYGLAIQDGYLYVGEPESIKRYKYDAKTMTAGPGQEIASLKGFGGGHWTRSLLFSRDGKRLCVGTGSGSNVSPGEDPRRAAINCYNPDGSGHEIFAAGTRNPIGLRYYPGTDTLWAAIQERDELGDDLVPDYFTHIQKGGFYDGWPYAYAGPTKTRATRASVRTWWPRPFRATSCSAPTSPFWTLSSTPASSSPRNTRAGLSSPSTDRGTAPCGSASPSLSFRSRMGSRPVPCAKC